MIIIYILALKQNLGSYKFKDYCKVETAVTQWLITLGSDFHQWGTEKHISQYGKHLSCGWDYMEKWWNSNAIRSELFLSEFNKTRNPKVYAMLTYFLTNPVCVHRLQYKQFYYFCTVLLAFLNTCIVNRIYSQCQSNLLCTLRKTSTKSR